MHRRRRSTSHHGRDSRRQRPSIHEVESSPRHIRTSTFGRTHPRPSERDESRETSSRSRSMSRCDIRESSIRRGRSASSRKSDYNCRDSSRSHGRDASRQMSLRSRSMSRREMHEPTVMEDRSVSSKRSEYNRQASPTRSGRRSSSRSRSYIETKSNASDVNREKIKATPIKSSTPRSNLNRSNDTSCNESRVSDVLDQIFSLRHQQKQLQREREEEKISSLGRECLNHSNMTLSTENSSGVSSIEDWVGRTVGGRPKFVEPRDTPHIVFDHTLESSKAVAIEEMPYRKSSSDFTTPIKSPPPPPPRRRRATIQEGSSPFPPAPVKTTKCQQSRDQWRSSNTSLLRTSESIGKESTPSFRLAPPPPPPPKRETSKSMLPLPPPREAKTSEPVMAVNFDTRNREPSQAISAERGSKHIISKPIQQQGASDEQGLNLAPMMPPDLIISKVDTNNNSQDNKLLNRGSRPSRVENKAHVDQHGDAGLYTGEVNEDGQPHGKGKMKYDNGVFYEGKWTNGRQESALQRDRMLSGFTSWKGQPKNKGRGEKGGGCNVYGMDWIDLNGMAGKYTGDVNDDGLPDGKGIMKYDFGLIAEGEWIKGVLNGGSRNGQMAGGATVVPGGTIVPGGGGTVLGGNFPGGISVVGGSGMSVVSGLGMMSIGGTGASLAPYTMNGNLSYGYSIHPGYNRRSSNDK